MKNEIARHATTWHGSTDRHSVVNVLDSADVGYISATYKDGISVTGVAISADEVAAKQFKGSVDGLVGLGKGFLRYSNHKSKVSSNFHRGNQQIYVDIEAIVNSLKVDTIR